MAGVGHRDMARRRIDHGQHAGDETVAEPAGGDVSVEIRERQPEVGLAEQVVAGGRVEAGHQQRRGDALAGHVGDGHGDPAAGKFDVVKVVASHAIGRLVIVTEVQSGCLGSLVGQKSQLDLGGELEFPVEVALPEHFRVESSVFDGQCALGGNPDQHIKITLFKRKSHVAAGQLNDSQRLTILFHQRGTDHGSQLHSRDALAAQKPVVSHYVGAENRLAALHGLADDCQADRRGAVAGFGPAASGSDHWCGAGWLVEQHEALIGLWEDLEESIEHSSEDFVEFEHLSEALGNLQHRLQFRLGIGDDLVAADRDHAELGDDRRRGGSVVDRFDADGKVTAVVGVAVGFVRFRAQEGRRWRRGGGLFVEVKLEVTQGDRVILPQFGWLVDGVAVDQRSVSTLEIFEEEVTVAFEDLRVMPTDSLVVEHDLATGMPSEDGPLTMELEQVPGDVSLLRGEVSQGWDSRWTGWLAGQSTPTAIIRTLWSNGQFASGSIVGLSLRKKSSSPCWIAKSDCSRLRVIVSRISRSISALRNSRSGSR